EASKLDFFQESFPSKEESGLFLQNFDEEDILHVDWNAKQVVWRLPEYRQVSTIDVQGALSNIAVMKNNMEVLMERSNRTQSPNGGCRSLGSPLPTARMEDPNAHICFVDRFFPSVLNITWLKNGQSVSQGVEETAFYPSVDATFWKFSYLPLVPEDEDIYVCQVKHGGDLTVPTHLLENVENMVCALGLAVAILAGLLLGSYILTPSTWATCNLSSHLPKALRMRRCSRETDGTSLKC
uniref:Ig-like domain-containing protein n=1 Tax=Salvator merianae TaxID=96440 RepID=A0A8D0BP33_SALMN